MVKENYEEVLGKEVELKALHAGLECGIIGAKIPGMQMISIGPDIRNPHTPDEKVKIDTVEKFYNLMKSILKELPSL